MLSELSVIAAAAECERDGFVRESRSEEKFRTPFNSTEEAIAGIDMLWSCLWLCNPISGKNSWAKWRNRKIWFVKVSATDEILNVGTIIFLPLRNARLLQFQKVIRSAAR